VPQHNSHHYATAAEVADYLGITRRAVYDMVSDGRLTGYRGLGSRILRLDLNEVDTVMAGKA
jgi:excisionase family DNA binding protein